jgi:O-antigen ligase
MASFFVFVLVLLPWLNPFSPGPTPAVVPFLFSWVCLSVALLVVAIASVERDALFRSAAMAWLLAACISALIGILQYFGATGWAGAWIDHPELGEAYGNLRQRNQFATLMNIGLASLLWRTALLSRGNPKVGIAVTLSRSTQYFTLLAAILLGIGNAASSSRTGLVQLVILVALTWLWRQRLTPDPRDTDRLRGTWVVALAAVSAYAIASFALPWLVGLDPMSSGAWARLRTGDAPCASRATLWANVLHLIAQKPWTGWGWGELDYAHFITLYPGPRFCDILDNAHNLPLHIAVEFGVPAALAFCGGLIWLIWRGQPQRAGDASRQIAWGVLAVIGLHSLLEYPLWYGPFQTAALLSLWQLSREPTQAPYQRRYANTHPYTRGLMVLAALSMIAACAFAAWQYQLVSQIYLPQSSRMAAYREDTLQKISHVALYQDQVRFADLTTTELDAQNAQTVHDLALDMLHFSPESQVVELVLESASLLGLENEVRFYSARYQAAFPDSYTKWLAAKAKP